MKGFEYYNVTTRTQATTLLAKYQEKSAILAGGSDMLAMMKDRVEGAKLNAPLHVFDIKGIKDLNYIKEQKGGLKIGATTTLSDIASSPLVAAKYPILVQAAGQVAVPQIRNVGTLGGNLCQRPRCWYFRGRLFKDCFRKGGDNCYAPGGENQYHAIFGGEMCYMVCPSDMAPALIALNAQVEMAGPKGNRTVPLELFYLKSQKDILKETILGPAEMVVAVEIPAPASGSKGVFLKLKERQAFDFAIVSVATVVTLKDNFVSEVRVLLGGVAPYPFRVELVEAILTGKPIKDRIAAACKAVVQGARPLSGNGYKVKAVQGILEEALTALA
jgi:xanthine dehydrogenase YagS FAD-binding subunit